MASSMPIACSWKFFGDKAAATTTHDNPSSKLSTLTFLIRETWKLQLETPEGSSPFLLDQVISPLFQDTYQTPPHVLAFPSLRKDYVLRVLPGLNLDHAVCGDLGSQLESFAVRLSETYGVKGFVMVAAVDVTRASVIGREEQFMLLEKMGLGGVTTTTHGVTVDEKSSEQAVDQKAVTRASSRKNIRMPCWARDYVMI